VGRRGAPLAGTLQQPLVQVGQLDARVGPELFGERASGGGERGKRFGRTPGRVQRPHQRGGQRLYHRMVLDQVRQRTDHRAAVALAHGGLGPRQHRVQPVTFAGLPDPGRPFAGHSGERFPAPRAERLAQQRRALGVRPCRIARGVEEAPEPM
jgi:hypothetical protein